GLGLPTRVGQNRRATQQGHVHIEHRTARMPIRSERYVDIFCREVSAATEAAAGENQRFLTMHYALGHPGAAARGQHERRTARILGPLRYLAACCTSVFE